MRRRAACTDRRGDIARPRPAYRQGPEPDRIYGALLATYNVRWRVDADGAEVLDVAPVDIPTAE